MTDAHRQSHDEPYAVVRALRDDWARYATYKRREQADVSEQQQAIAAQERAAALDAILRDAERQIPREPTDTMLEAGFRFVDDDIAGAISLLDVWRAMYDAARGDAPAQPNASERP